MKRFSELTAEERREAAISQDHGDGRDAAYSAQRLGMALSVVEAILARQADAWKAKHAERIKAAQITWPAKPPQNVCCSCVNLWIKGVYTGRAAGVAEPRAVMCPHNGGETYDVAYLCRDPVRWVEINGVPGSQLNSLYKRLCEDDGIVQTYPELKAELLAQPGAVILCDTPSCFATAITSSVRYTGRFAKHTKETTT